MVEKLLRCIQCHKVIPIYGCFIEGDDEAHLPGVIWSKEDMKRKEEFFKSHAAHPLEELSVDFDTYISDKPSFELIKISYFEATNGRERFLIKRCRERFDQPAHYEIIPGKLKVSNVALKFLEEELSRQLMGLNGSAQLGTEVINVLVKSIEEELKNIPPEKLFQEIDIEEAETPLYLNGTLKEKHWRNIIGRLQNNLSPNDFLHILDFFEKNNLIREFAPLIIQREVSILNI